MTTRIDVSFLGRQPGLMLRTAREIEREARWGRLIFAGKVLVAALFILVALLVYAVVAP